MNKFSHTTISTRKFAQAALEQLNAGENGFAILYINLLGWYNTEHGEAIYQKILAKIGATVNNPPIPLSKISSSKLYDW